MTLGHPSIENINEQGKRGVVRQANHLSWPWHKSPTGHFPYITGTRSRMLMDRRNERVTCNCPQSRTSNVHPRSSKTHNSIFITRFRNMTARETVGDSLISLQAQITSLSDHHVSLDKSTNNPANRTINRVASSSGGSSSPYGTWMRPAFRCHNDARGLIGGGHSRPWNGMSCIDFESKSEVRFEPQHSPRSGVSDWRISQNLCSSPLR